MLVSFVLPPAYGKGLQPIDIKHVTIGKVVQKTEGEGQSFKIVNTFGHIVGFTRVNGELALRVQWDDRPDEIAAMPKHLVLL